jgi:predicted transcriptional regulator
VLVKEPRYRRSVSSNQVRLLYILFKFRFGASNLIAEVVKKDRSTVYESLRTLEQQGYLRKFHDKTYRLRGRPAIYTLAAKGIKYLRENSQVDQTTLRNFYKNKRIAVENEPLVDQCLLVFRLFNVLKAQTGKTFLIYTKHELDKDDFVNPKPELWLQRQGKSQKPDYILDIFPASTMTWLLRKRLRQHQDFADEYEYLYPNVLLVAGNTSTEKRLFRQVESAIQDFEFYITQQEMLLSGDKQIWIDLEGSCEDEIERVQLR